MPKNTTKIETLEVTVTRTWPLHRIKKVQVQIAGKDLWHNDITLTKEQAEQLHTALADILGKTDEAIVS